MKNPPLRSLRAVAGVLLATVSFASWAAELSLVPYPERVDLQRGSFALSNEPVLRHAPDDPAAKAIAKTFVERVASACGRSFDVAAGAMYPAGELSAPPTKDRP